MCNPTGQRSTGAGLYILGLLVAGVMFTIIGSEYNKNTTNYSHIEDFFWVYAIAMLIGTIGLILDNGERFCGEKEFQGIDYFGSMFQVVSGFAWAGFGVGIAHYYEAGMLVNTVAVPNNLQLNATERSSLAWMSGVAAIFHGLGSIFALKRIICCEGNFKCDMPSIFNIVNIVLDICLIIFWFLFADALDKNPVTNKGDKDRRTYSYLIGIVYILMSLLGTLLILDVFCGEPGPGPEPYGPGPEPYGPPKPYGPTPGYGDKPKPAY